MIFFVTIGFESDPQVPFIQLQKSTELRSCGAAELLTQLVEDVTLDPFSDDVSFRLGGRALNALLQMFTYNDFAIRRFLGPARLQKLPPRAHFRRSPLPRSSARRNGSFV